jgi:hypothetical protein
VISARRVETHLQLVQQSLCILRDFNDSVAASELADRLLLLIVRELNVPELREEESNREPFKSVPRLRQAVGVLQRSKHGELKFGGEYQIVCTSGKRGGFTVAGSLCVFSSWMPIRLGGEEGGGSIGSKRVEREAGDGPRLP